MGYLQLSFMKNFTEEEVVNLLKKAAKDIDTSIKLGIFTSIDEAMPHWIKANITNPPPKT